LRFIVFLIFLISTLSAEHRIVTLSPATNEIVFALGLGKNVVGTTHYANYPEEAKKITKVGGYQTPSLEKIASLRPTLVVTEASGAETTAKLQKLGIRTLSIKMDSIQSIKEAVLSIGKALGERNSASKIVANIDSSLQRLQSTPRTNKKMLMVFGNNIDLSKNIYAAGHNLYFAELIVASGFENAVQKDKTVQPILNMEGIIACNPDIVVVLFPYTKEKNISASQIKAAWTKLPIKAAKTGAIYVLENDYVSIPSDRVSLFADDLYNIAKDYGAKVR